MKQPKDNKLTEAEKKNPSIICWRKGHQTVKIGNSKLKRCIRCQSIL